MVLSSLSRLILRVPRTSRTPYTAPFATMDHGDHNNERRDEDVNDRRAPQMVRRHQFAQEVRVPLHPVPCSKVLYVFDPRALTVPFVWQLHLNMPMNFRLLCVYPSQFGGPTMCQYAKSNDGTIDFWSRPNHAAPKTSSDPERYGLFTPSTALILPDDTKTWMIEVVVPEDQQQEQRRDHPVLVAHVVNIGLVGFDGAVANMYAPYGPRPNQNAQ